VFDESVTDEFSLIPGVFIATENKKMCEDLYENIFNYCIERKRSTTINISKTLA